MKKITGKYRIIIVLIALLCTVALLFSVNDNLLPFAHWTQHIIPRTPVTLTAIPLGTMDKPIQITRPGSVASSTSVPINAEFSGLLIEIYVTEGQAVKVGQPLFKLKSSLEVPANQTIVPPQQTQSNYENALKEFNRTQKLYEIGAIPRRQLEIATTRLQEAKESLTNTQNTIQASNAPIINGFATINAPIDGIVTGLSTVAGKMVQAGQQLFALGSGQEVEVLVHLDQNDLYLVHLGTPATIEVSQQTIVGQVSRIYPQVEANQNPSFLAHIKLTNNPAGILKSGMSANVRIDTGKSSIVPAVPTASVFQDDQDRKFIYIAVNGNAIIQQIEIGETIGDLTEITSNLPQQSMIIINNIYDIKNGDAVSIIDK